MYPRRPISSAHARAVRAESQPSTVGSLENPYPGSDGSTRWNASSARPPCAVGSVNGPTVSNSSTTEPGQPCVMISGNASSCGDLTWMKWICTPSISVVNCGSAFSLASHVRQSYSSVQYSASACIVASCTPCERSDTSSSVGQRVADRRLRKSSTRSCGISTRNDWISDVVPMVVLIVSPQAQRPEGDIDPSREEVRLMPGRKGVLGISVHTT